jgi:CheY-like chemotaxis protein
MELRKLENYKETPVLALTADVMQDAINKCYEAGMQGHIAKPIIINSFYEKLYTMLSHEETILLENKKETKKKASKSRSNKKFQELSIENGLEHAHNDEELYKSLLEDFVNMYKDSASELAKLVQSNDFQKARKKALEIKETALHIGAYKLYENVAAMQYEFEKAQRSSSLEMLRYYKESLELLLKEIKAYLN